MCGTSATADRLLVAHEARGAADELLGDYLRLPLRKAINLGTPGGFDRAVALLAARLRRATGRADVDAVRDAMAVLDVDWPRTTAAERRRLVSEAMAAAGRATALIPARIQVPLGDAAESVERVEVLLAPFDRVHLVAPVAQHRLEVVPGGLTAGRERVAEPFGQRRPFDQGRLCFLQVVQRDEQRVP